MQEDEEDEENSLTNEDDKKPANHKITMMMEENDHTCSQNKIDVLEQEFRNEVKKTLWPMITKHLMLLFLRKLRENF